MASAGMLIMARQAAASAMPGRCAPCLVAFAWGCWHPAPVHTSCHLVPAALPPAHARTLALVVVVLLLLPQIVGLPPFYSKDTRAAYRRLLTEPLEFKDDVSEAARTLIKGLLVADPSKRLGAIAKDAAKDGTDKSHPLEGAWGDATPIKTQAWFKGLRWDAVLLRQVPCMRPPPSRPYACFPLVASLLLRTKCAR